MNKSVDWRRIRTMAVWSSPFLILSLYTMLYTFYQRVVILEDDFEEHIEMSENAIAQAIERGNNQNEKLDKLLAAEAKRTRREMTIKGKGQAGSFGTGISYVQLNADILTYIGEKRVRITNLSSDANVSQIFEIRGTFEGPTVRLVRFSIRAADQLEVEGSVTIRIEPVLDDPDYIQPY